MPSPLRTEAFELIVLRTTDMLLVPLKRMAPLTVRLSSRMSWRL